MLGTPPAVSSPASGDSDHTHSTPAPNSGFGGFGTATGGVGASSTTPAASGGFGGFNAASGGVGSATPTPARTDPSGSFGVATHARATVSEGFGGFGVDTPTVSSSVSPSDGRSLRCCDTVVDITLLSHCEYVHNTRHNCYSGCFGVFLPWYLIICMII
jgi:hypothetical protein